MKIEKLFSVKEKPKKKEEMFEEIVYDLPKGFFIGIRSSLNNSGGFISHFAKAEGMKVPEIDPNVFHEYDWGHESKDPVMELWLNEALEKGIVFPSVAKEIETIWYAHPHEKDRDTPIFLEMYLIVVP